MTNAVLNPELLPATPPMDLGVPLAGEAMSATPLKLRSDRGVGLFGTDRREGSLIRAHKAIDLMAPKGQPVMTTAEGAVVQTGGIPGDRFVTVHHKPFELGWVSSYRHLNQVVVKKGQQVVGGQQLAEVANDHLHFEIRQIFNTRLLRHYLAVYEVDPTLPDPVDPSATTRYDFGAVPSNLGNTGHSLALDPTRVMYEWENRMFRNDQATRHEIDDVTLSHFQEVWRDRMRFVLVRVPGESRDLYVPLTTPSAADLTLIETLRTGLQAGATMKLVWRDSRFFSRAANSELASIVAEVTLRS